MALFLATGASLRSISNGVHSLFLVLGRVCKLQPAHDRRDQQHRLIIGRALLVPCGNAAALLKPIDQALDGIPEAIERPIKRARPALTPLPGNGDADPMSPPVLPDRPAA